MENPVPAQMLAMKQYLVDKDGHTDCRVKTYRRNYHRYW